MCPRHSIEERFFSKVKKTETCWLWTGTKTQGYGWFTVASYKTMSAYLWAYTHLKGPVPGGLQLDHVCRNRACVNPDHLEPVTQRENILRSPIALAAVNARKTHCIRGHEFTPENTYQRKYENGRRCRVCMKNQSAKGRLKSKGSCK